MQENQTIRAKFWITGVSETNDGAAENPQKTGENVTMQAVTTGSEENKSFSQYTPSGSLSMHVSNPDLYGAFVQGEEVYIDITKAAAPAQETGEQQEN